MSFLFAPKRWLAPNDYINLIWGLNMQIAVEFEDPKYVPPAVDEFVRCMNSFRCQANPLYIRANHNETPVYKIPSNLKTLKECALWMNKAHTPKWNPLATIACDDNRIVISSSHSCNDGTRCIQLIEHICHPEKYGTMPTSPVAKAMYHQHIKEIFSHDHTTVYCSADPKLSHLFPKRPVSEKKDSKFLLPSIEIPISDLVGYDPTTQHVKKLTELQWITQSLAGIVFEQDYSFNNIGISTVLDLRRFIPESEATDPSCQECIASVPVYGHPTMDMTLNELGNQMRQNFNKHIANKDYYSHIRSIWEAIFRPWIHSTPPGIALEVSSMGPVHLKSPVKDAWISLITPDPYKIFQTSFLTYTLMNQNNSTKTFVGQFQCNSRELNELDADLFVQMVKFAMTQLDYKMTVSESLHALEKFREKAIRAQHNL